MRSSALTLVTQCRVFLFSTFSWQFLKSKKTWLGQKIGTKNLKWSALYKIHMFSVLFFRKIWTANFPVAISRDFFLPFLLPKFSVAQPSPLHTQKTAVRVRRKKWTALCFSQLFSAEVYTRASRSENIHKRMLFIIYRSMCSKTGMLKHIHSLCFKSNTVKKRLVSHYQNFLVVA